MMISNLCVPSCLKNKTTLCLLITTLVTSFFFLRSVVVREKWIAPTFLAKPAPHNHGAAHHLIAANNWLKEGIINLNFSSFLHPASVEMPNLYERFYYGTFPPGTTLLTYSMLKILEVTGIVPDIYNKRGTQLLVVIFYMYFTHFLMTVVICWLLFFLCRKIGYDNLNSTLISTIPPIIQFHNSSSVYWHHISYYQDIINIFPFVLYVFLEMLRTTNTSQRVTHTVNIIQPLLMFWGLLTSWFFVFVIMTVYVERLVKKQICPPVSLKKFAAWAKKSFYFFMPAIFAITVWFYTLFIYYLNIDQSNFFSTKFRNHRTLLEHLLHRMGFADGLESIMQYLKMSLFSHPHSDYGTLGVVMLYDSFYMVIRKNKLSHREASVYNISYTAYLMLFVPALMYHLFFLSFTEMHEFSSIMFSPALSLSFALAPIFILLAAKKSHLIPAIHLKNGRSVALAALLGVGISIIYAYTQLYNSPPVTKRFTYPDYNHVVVGDFVRNNTGYHDVVFSSDYHEEVGQWYLISVHFPGKVIYFATNLDRVYHKTKAIEENFTIRILYYEWRREEMNQLTHFLEAQKIAVDDIQSKNVGDLLTFDGQKFLAWYERVHACDLYPQRCGRGVNYQEEM